MRIIALHTKIKSITRKLLGDDQKSGKSVVAAAAYRAGQRIFCKRSRKYYDYTRKQGVEKTMIFLPSSKDDAKEKGKSSFQERGFLWNNLELLERNGASGDRAGLFKKNVTLARETSITIPTEFTAEERSEFAELVGRYFTKKYGCIVDIAIHIPHDGNDDRNVHLHMLWTDRIFKNGAFGKKMNVFRQKGTSSEAMKDLRAYAAEALNTICKRSGYDVQINYLKKNERDTSHHGEDDGADEIKKSADLQKKQSETYAQMKNRQRSEYLALKNEFDRQMKHSFASLFVQYAEARDQMKRQFLEVSREKKKLRFLKKAFLFVTRNLESEMQKKEAEIEHLRQDLKTDLEGLKVIFKEAHQKQKSKYQGIFKGKVLAQRKRHVEERKQVKKPPKKGRHDKRKEAMGKKQAEKRKTIRKQKDALRKGFQKSANHSVQSISNQFQKVSCFDPERNDKTIMKSQEGGSFNL